MMNHSYYNLDQMLAMIDEPNRTACERLVDDNRQLLQTAHGSTNNHQAWPGGWWDHITEAMNIALQLYGTFNAIRPLPFSVSDLLLTVFCHDIEKPWKYELREDGQLHHRPGMEDKEDHQKFRIAKLQEYDFELSEEHINGIKYAEGELSDYSPRQRKMGRLAAFVHVCDVLSARAWHDHPASSEDPWLGAQRSLDA